MANKSAASTSPPRPARTAGEVESTITLGDFLDLWMRYRLAFLAGLFIVAVVTLIWTKFLRMTFYEAETTFFISSQYTSTSRVGVADIDLFEPNRSEKFIVLQVLQAEEWLRSRPLIVEAAARVARPGKNGEPAFDLYELLKIREETPAMREAVFAQTVRDDLMHIIQLQTSGMMRLRVEMPDPVAAARFANACVEVLQERFTEENFRYLDQAVQLYEEGLRLQQEARDAMARELLELGPFDMSPLVNARRSGLQEQLDLQAEALGALTVNIQHLRMATDERAKQAAQPVQVTDPAWPPIRKSRPKTTMTILVAGAIYTFIFMLALVVTGWSRQIGPVSRSVS